ncbi:MAG: hypothetical protein DRQ39_11585, partial [Gammaproteobacteria bacterium]
MPNYGGESGGGFGGGNDSHGDDNDSIGGFGGFGESQQEADHSGGFGAGESDMGGNNDVFAKYAIPNWQDPALNVSMPQPTVDELKETGAYGFGYNPTRGLLGSQFLGLPGFAAGMQWNNDTYNNMNQQDQAMMDSMMSDARAMEGGFGGFGGYQGDYNGMGNGSQVPQAAPQAAAPQQTAG